MNLIELQRALGHFALSCEATLFPTKVGRHRRLDDFVSQDFTF